MATNDDHVVWQQFLQKQGVTPQWELDHDPGLGKWCAAIVLPPVPSMFPTGFTMPKQLDSKKKTAESKCIAFIANILRAKGMGGGFKSINARAESGVIPQALINQAGAQALANAAGTKRPAETQAVSALCKRRSPGLSGVAKCLQGEWWTSTGEKLLVRDIQLFSVTAAKTVGTISAITPGEEVPTDTPEGETTPALPGSQVWLKAGEKISTGCPADKEGGLCPTLAAYIAWDDGGVWQRWLPEGVAQATVSSYVTVVSGGGAPKPVPKKWVPTSELYAQREEYGYSISNARNCLNEYLKSRKLPLMEPEIVQAGPVHSPTIIARMRIPLVRKPTLVVEEQGAKRQTTANLLFLKVVTELVRLGELQPFRSKSKLLKEGAATIEVQIPKEVVHRVATYLSEIGVSPAPALAVAENLDLPENLDVDVDASMYIDGNSSARTREIEWISPSWGGRTPWASPAYGNEDQAIEQLQASASRRTTSWDYMQARKTVAALPISACVEEIMTAVNGSVVSIIQGSTGCGKTTQLPQLVLDKAIEQGWGTNVNVVCTQPRRIAAITVAERVAQERGEDIGVSVGYHVRFASRMPSRGYASICYMTTGMLLTKLKSGGLHGISHVIVDEVHERDLETDFLLTVLRSILFTMPSPQVRLILMSATLDQQKWVSYFGMAQAVEIPGRLHPVEQFYLEDALQQLGMPCNPAALKELENDIPVDLIEKLLVHIVTQSREAQRGAVLVFLPGWDAIQTIDKRIQKNAALQQTTHVHLLHSQISKEEQRAAFPPTQAPYVKVILSTNIAESSVTIADVVYVVDACRRKEMICQMTPDGRTSHRLASTWASKQNVQQRAGRAGRLRPGICYRLVSQSGFETLPEIPTPDMQRLPLHSVALSVRDLQLGEVAEFLAQCPDPPAMPSVDHAVRLLTELKAFDENQTLTYLGRLLARLPVEPQMGYALICGCVFGLAEPMAALCALTSAASPFVNEYGRAQSAASIPPALNRPAALLSDHHDLLVTYYEYKAVGSEAFVWCMANNVVPTVMQHVSDAAAQIQDHLERVGFGEKAKVSCRDWISRLGTDRATKQDRQQWAVLTMLLGLGQPNFAVRMEGRQVLLGNSTVGKISQSMAHTDKSPRLPELPLVLFFEQRHSEWNTKLNMATACGALSCLLGAARWVRYSSEKQCVMLDDWVPVRLPYDDAAVLATLRATLKMLALRAAAEPSSCLGEWSVTELVEIVTQLVDPSPEAKPGGV